MSAKRTSWNEFSSSMASAVVCLSTGRKFNFSKAQVGDLSSHTTKYSSPFLTQKIFINMRKVGKGFSRVETPLFEGMLVPQQVVDDVDDVVNDDLAADVEPTLPSPTSTTQPHHHHKNYLPHHRKFEKKNKLRVSGLKRLRKVGTTQMIESSAYTVMDDQEDASKQGKIIANINADENVTLKDVAAVAKEIEVEKTDEPVKLQEVIEVVTTAKLMTKVVTAATTTITVVTPITTAAPSAARRRKRVVIRDPEEIVAPSIIIHTEPKSKDKGKGIMVEEPKPLKKQAQIEQDKKPKPEKNMMVYLKNIVGFKMDCFKGMSYDDIHPIFEKYFNSSVAFLEKSKEQLEEEESRALKRQSESLEEKATKKQKLDEEVEELKKHLQILPNDDDDDVYTETTPLALKVPVVDYEIYSENNKPFYKIIRSDGSHQLFLSFLSLLRNFDREDFEMLWQIVQEIFTSSKPKNFSGDFLLTTLTYMFEKPNVEAQVWKNQRSFHGLVKVKSWRLLESCGVHIITFTTTRMILLVERSYPLTRFTLDQMMNNVRLEVEEESEVSLELLRFVR
uniref:Uncharacterized protein n=1 Tax=Tanacetum cinerariifolium TaxID=118510 RepID=A0A699ITL8_TANCI|nr:hypothetical protein [Tanacetum cinerariifolium]